MASEQWFKVGAGLVVSVTASLAYLMLRANNQDEQMGSDGSGFDLSVDSETGQLI